MNVSTPHNPSPPHKKISIVTPFYNEEDGIPHYFATMRSVLEPLSRLLHFEFICVNDGSRDGTLAALQDARIPFATVTIIDLSRNFGKEAALSAGLDHATGDAVIPVDADMQDPPELIPEMINRWLAGAPVVLAMRSDRASDSWMKRTTASAFYTLHNRLADLQIPPNVGDFRLLDRHVVDTVRRLPESQRFMKGLFAWAGFQQDVVTYIRPQRVAGSTKMNYLRLIDLAIEGVTSFSTAPLRASTIAGMAFSTISMAYGLFIALRALVGGTDVPGYASLFVAVVFMGGVQLLSLGVLGEYVGRIYMESKRRPIYVVRDIVSKDPIAPEFVTRDRKEAALSPTPT